MADPNTLVALGDLLQGPTLLAIFGLVITVIMMVRKIKGSIFYGMIATTLLGMAVGLIELPGQVVSKIPRCCPNFWHAAFEVFFENPLH